MKYLTTWKLGIAVALLLCTAGGLLWLPAYAAQQAQDSAGLSDDALANATYMSEFTDSGEVTLVDGEVEMDMANGDEGNLYVVLTDSIARGDLNGDDVEDAAVIITSSTGGTGIFYDLAAVLNVDGEPQNVAIAELGDRVNILDLAVADGQIMVDMMVQGLDDPMCCPSLEVTNTYQLDGNMLAEVTHVEGVDEGPREIKLDAELQPDADPNLATIELGGTDDIWLNPTMVSVLSGILEGEGVAADSLDPNCPGGIIPARPDVVLNWKEDATVDMLRVFFVSTGDPTLVVVQPDGSLLCNDDLNPLMLDPYLEIPHPQTGRYAIYVGSYEGNAHVPGFLVFTSLHLNPATLDLTQLLPREVDPAAVGEVIPESALLLDHEPSAKPAETALEDGYGSYSEEMTGGGSLGVFNVELNNQLCTGFIDAIPTFKFDWQGQAERLHIFFEGDNDSTLVVRTPDGSYACNDDYQGSRNMNPRVEIVPKPGEYIVYVGSFSPSEVVSGTLTITEDVNAEPAVLTSDMLDEGE
ncbi:MAG: hypothetical protein KDE46_10770 [Caldilineaceae bacterium]|nr:hypothetical protein [Caldilineaceae bacterium]